MILNRLNEYYNTLREKNPKEFPEYGFQIKELPFIVEIDEDGNFIQLEDTRVKEGKKKRARKYILPKEEIRTSINAWKVANILWDHIGYLFGIGEKEDIARRQHQSFIKKIEDVFGSDFEDKGIQALLKFLKRGDFSKLKEQPEWKEIEKIEPSMSFRLKGDDRLIAQRDAVIKRVREFYKNQTADKIFCPIQGEIDSKAKLHSKIKGVWGTKNSKATLISFNQSAFRSYNKKKEDNAPLGERAVSAYVTTLNYLLSNEKHTLHMGGVTVVFWAKKDNKLEENFSSFFGVSKEESPERVKEIFKAVELGVIPESEREIPFYVLGLSPNLARISIRFWYEGSVGDTLDNIFRYFQELKIVKRFKDEPDYLTLGRLLLSTTFEHKFDKVAPNLSGALFNSVLKGTRYPQMLLPLVITRIRAEISKRPVTYERASLLKAILIRNYKKEIPMSLDTTRKDPAYLLGRLFAILEHLQGSAQGSLNASIRERYYATASSTPILVFPVLIRLSNYHLSKLDKEAKRVWYDKQIASILDMLKEWPTRLDLKGQALFALGYYHQNSALYTKKEEDKK